MEMVLAAHRRVIEWDPGEAESGRYTMTAVLMRSRLGCLELARGMKHGFAGD